MLTSFERWGIRPNGEGDVGFDGDVTVGGTVSAAGLTDTTIIADASFTIGAENTNVRNIAIQLKNSAGDDLDFVAGVFVAVFANAARTAFATGGSTGIAIGTDGALIAVVAKKLFFLTCEADGDIDLTWTDTGTEAVYLGVMLPNGRWVMSAVIANT